MKKDDQPLTTQELINLLRGWAIGRYKVPYDWMDQAADRLEEFNERLLQPPKRERTGNVKDPESPSGLAAGVGEGK